MERVTAALVTDNRSFVRIYPIKSHLARRRGNLMVDKSTQ